MNQKPVVGLLPLYIKLYDSVRKDARGQFEPLITEAAAKFEARGIDVVRAPICCIEPEFRAAVKAFEDKGVELIVTLHLAYSPSLESVTALTSSAAPILMLDTTMDEDFGLTTNPERIMFNHGIHGLQDLANMLRRHEKPYRVIAGHLSASDVMDRAAAVARAASAARHLNGMRVLRIGETFRGMGDFAVADSLLKKTFDITVDTVKISALADWVNKVTAAEIEAELDRDRRAFSIEAPEELHRRSVKVGLGLRAFLADKGYSAFSANFLAFDTADEPVNTVPFLEASKAMARGLGYAGEGDVLTASLVGALNSAFDKVNFTEMFCPDWRGGSVFLSHMGEFNPATAAGKPRLVEKDYPFTDAYNPAVITAPPLPGPAVLVNLAPGPKDSFALVIASVEVLGETTNKTMRDSVHGWIRPECSLETFLERYSLHGGTHHSALVHGVNAEALEAFAQFAGMKCTVIC